MEVDATKNQVAPQRVLRNVISNYAGKLISLLVGFLLTPFILNELGASTYGLWALVGSVVAYIALLDFGITGAVIKYVAEHRARGENEQAQRLTATALWLYSGLGLLAVLISTGIAMLFPAIFNVPPDQQATATWLVVVMGVALGISIPCTTTTAVLLGLQRYDIVNLNNTIGTILNAAATVFILGMGGGVIGMAAASIPITLTVQALNVYFIHRIAPELHIGWRSADRSLVRTVARFSWSIFVMNVMGRVMTKTDEIVIGIYMPVVAVTPYMIARRLSEMAQILTDQFMKVLLPIASELNAENNPLGLRTLYLTGTRLTMAIFLPVGTTLVILAGPILTAWVGAEYARFAHLVVILTIASFIDTSQWPAGAVLQGMARHQPLVTMSVINALANLGLSILLIQSLGLTGVALGTLIPTTIVCLGLVFPYALRTIGVGFAQALKEIFLFSLAPAFPMAVLLFAANQVVELTTWLPILVTVGLGALLYGIGYLLIGASQYEKQALFTFTQNTIRFVKKRLSSS